MRNRKFHFTLIMMLIIQFGYSQSKDMFFEEANTFFKTYVMDNSFNYVAARNNPMLDIFINAIRYLRYKMSTAFLIKKYILWMERRSHLINLRKRIF